MHSCGNGLCVCRRENLAWMVVCWNACKCAFGQVVCLNSEFNSCRRIVLYKNDLFFVFFRSHVRKNSPSFSVFRSWMHGCSDVKLCHVPIQSIFVEIFLLDRKVIDEVWGFRVTDGGVYSDRYDFLWISLPRWKWKQPSIHWRLLLRNKCACWTTSLPGWGKSYVHEMNLVRHKKQHHNMGNGPRLEWWSIIW